MPKANWHKKPNPILTGGVVLLVLFAIAVHTAILIVMPDPLVQPDSNGFLSPAFSLLYNGKFTVDFIRTFGYPLFLYICLLIIPNFTGVLIVQHSLALLTAGLTGLLYYRFFDRNLVRSMMVSFLTAILPRGVVYAHSIMSESPYCFLLMLCLLIFLTNAKENRPWAWVLLGVTLFVSMAVRPVGIAVLAAMCISLPLYVKGKQLLRAGFLLFLGVGFFSGVTHMLLPERAAGIRELSALEIFGMSAKWLDMEKIDDPAVQQTLLPIYSADPTRFTNANWVRTNLYNPIRDLEGKKRSTTGTLRHLAWTAISNHPWLFAWAQIETAALFVDRYSRRPPYLYPKEISVARGLSIYSVLLREFPKAASLVRFNPEDQAPYFEKMRRTPLYPYESGSLLSTPIYPWATIIGYVPPFALLAAVLLIWKRVQHREVILLLGTIFFHVLLNGLINGDDGRFALPVEPLYIVLLMGGVSVFFTKNNRLDQAKPRQPSATRKKTV